MGVVVNDDPLLLTGSTPYFEVVMIALRGRCFILSAFAVPMRFPLLVIVPITLSFVLSYYYLCYAFKYVLFVVSS